MGTKELMVIMARATEKKKLGHNFTRESRITHHPTEKHSIYARKYNNNKKNQAIM